MEYDIEHLLLDAALDVQFDVDVDDDDSLNDARVRNFGRYVQVIKVDYDGIMCAAKQLVKDDNVYIFFRSRLTYFKRECLMHSKLSHPNIVKMLGVCYNGAVQGRFDTDSIPWPVLVMELVEYDLSELELFAVPMYVKLSILQDVSRGIQYLHTECSPPIVHCNLSIFSILLTEHLVGKICDFRLSQEMLPEIENIDSHPEAASESGLPFDVLLFGCMACQVATKRCNNLRPLHKVHSKVCSIDSTRLKSYIDGISDKLVKQLLVECIDDNPNKRPSISVAHETIKRIVDELYADDKDIKNAYSMALKEGKTQSRDLQVLLIGAENTGKTCLVSSFLSEKFIEGQAATEGVDMDVCKIFCKNWKRITHSDKIDHLYEHFLSEFKGNAMRWLPREDTNENEAAELLSTAVAEENCNVDSADFVQAVPVRPPPKNDAFPEPNPRDLKKAFSSIPRYDHHSLNVVVWDFAGQAIFHNTHSLFISEEGVPIITFDASKELSDPVIPREGQDSLPSLECSTGISSIHYWLQVVDSMCSMEGSDGDLSPLLPTALLAGTHIDKLHPDIKMARKIARQRILPILEKELREKPYVKHLAGSKKGIKFALENYCFFVSNKCRDKEIERLKIDVVKCACSLKKKQPVFFLKIEQAILNCRDNVISISKLCEIVSSNAFSINEKSPEFEEIMTYFHNKRTFLHFSQVESLQNVVVLSPSWLAKLFSYVIAACSYDFLGTDLDKAWKRLTEYGILQENILQHMLDKFYTDYPSEQLHITYQQVVDILLCFHLLARITREAWFSEEGYPSLPESGDVFIVPSLVPSDSNKTPPNTDRERIVYFLFQDSFIPTSLLSQLITNCIDRNVKRNNRLLWMRQGMVGLQLGAHQKYYISRCKEKQSLQLTITLVGSNQRSMQERKQLIDDVESILNDIMKVFMPAAKRPLLFVPCPLCSTLHIPLQDVCSGNTIFCPKSGDAALPSGYYGDLVPSDQEPTLTNTAIDAVTVRKLEVFQKYYSRLSGCLPIKNLSSHFVTEGIITFEEEEEILNDGNPCSAFLRKIAYSLRGGTDAAFDKMLTVIHEHGDTCSKELINEINREL